MLHGDRFTRQCRLIEHRKAAADGTVNRNDVSSSHQEAIARFDRVQINLLERAVAVADRGAWRARQERRHFAARMTLGETLEILAAGIHQRDDRGGQVLAEYQSGRHRQCCNDIEADIAATQTRDDLNDQHNQHRRRAGGPDPPGPRAAPDRQKDKAESQSGSRERDQEWTQHGTG